MDHEVVSVTDPAVFAARAAEWVAARATEVVRDRGRFRFAVSGGSTPWAMFDALLSHDVPWEHVQIFQVDERVAPEGDPDRNLTHLRRALGRVPATVFPMAVNDPNLHEAAEYYAGELPERFDLVHLGLGPDGHTASLVPGDPVLEVRDRLVAATAPYQGHRRITLTYPALARADQILWLVTGEEKRPALARLLGGDRSIPAGRVEAARSTVLTDISMPENREPEH